MALEDLSKLRAWNVAFNLGLRIKHVYYVGQCCWLLKLMVQLYNYITSEFVSTVGFGCVEKHGWAHRKSGIYGTYQGASDHLSDALRKRFRSCESGPARSLMLSDERMKLLCCCACRALHLCLPERLNKAQPETAHVLPGCEQLCIQRAAACQAFHSLHVMVPIHPACLEENSMPERECFKQPLRAINSSVLPCGWQPLRGWGKSAMAAMLKRNLCN